MGGSGVTHARVRGPGDLRDLLRGGPVRGGNTGPLLALDIRESARGGFWAGPYIATGHSVLELLVVVLLAVGLLRVTEKGPAFAAVALAGGAFLVWMGWGMIRRPAGDLPVVPSEQVPVRRYHPGRPILGGIVFSATNPFWGLWWITVGATFMAEAQSRELGAAGI